MSDDGSVTNGERLDSRNMSEIKSSSSPPPPPPGTPRQLSVLSNFKYEYFVAGISGGVVSTLMLHPLDLIKIRFAGKSRERARYCKRKWRRLSRCASRSPARGVACRRSCHGKKSRRRCLPARSNASSCGCNGISAAEASFASPSWSSSLFVRCDGLRESPSDFVTCATRVFRREFSREPARHRRTFYGRKTRARSSLSLCISLFHRILFSLPLSFSPRER